MSFLFGTAKPASPPKQMGVPEHRLASNEAARCVPYLAGRQRLGLSFISECFDQRTVEVYQTQGKQKTKTGYNYYASLLCLICNGPLDGLHDLFYNSDSVYTESTKIKALTLTFSSITGLGTFTTKNAHGLATGTAIVVNGAEQGDYNGPTVITVTSATQFTFPIIGVPTTPASGDIYAVVRLDPVLRGVETQVDLTVPDFGPVILQWGTEEQEPLTEELKKSGIKHPNYRGNATLFLNRNFLGFNQENVQNLEAVVSRFPKQDWLDLADIEDECNPIAFIVDVLQNPRMGLRVATAKIDTATMLSTAAKLQAEGLGFSPLITRQQEARQALNDALDYIDGYWTINAAGQIGVKLARGDSEDIPTLTDADLTAPAQFDPEDWSTVKTGVTVKFMNRDVNYTQDARTYRDAAAFSVKQEVDIETIDRPWFTRPDVAAAVAKSMARARALPNLTGRLKVRMTGTLFGQLLPGAQFKLDLSKRSLPNRIFRVTERIWPDPAKPEFEIGFRIDRSYLYIAPSPALLTVDATSPTVDSDQQTSDQETL